jgi:hypothetical protein
MTLSQAFASAVTAAVLTTFGASVMAQALVVKCETRANRSRASVDGNNLASGLYTAVLTSGANSAQSTAKPTKGDEVAFDFDSNPKDIRKGATAIASDFIVGGKATGKLLDAGGNVVIERTANCKRK